MFILKRLKSRLGRLETALKDAQRSLYPGNEDAFMDAIVGEDKEKYRKGEGYDFIAALTSTAAEDWKEGNEETQ